MKLVTVLLVAVSALCLAEEQLSSDITYSTEPPLSSDPSFSSDAPFSSDSPSSSSPEPYSSPITLLLASSSKKPELLSKRFEQKQSEGRGFGRMEVSDAQLEMALNDKRYLQRQLKCTLGEAPCDPVGRRLRTLAPLVVRGSCPQCTPTEMRQIQKVLLHMQRNFPKEWARIVRTYQ